MAHNIEIKARARQFDDQFKLACEVADGNATLIQQTDTFYHTSKEFDAAEYTGKQVESDSSQLTQTQARLKLREFPDQAAQLIFYQRADQAGPSLSDYHITHTADAAELKFTLAQTLGQLAVVKKHRQLLLCGRTRIHFDVVEGLGEFIELEVVLDNRDEIPDGEQEARRLMRALHIEAEDLLACAYVDLLLRSS